jgi:hypothetical protein
MGERWEWTKRFRVWEANRKQFQTPENWLEPEAADDEAPPPRLVERARLRRRRRTKAGSDDGD